MYKIVIIYYFLGRVRFIYGIEDILKWMLFVDFIIK